MDRLATGLACANGILAGRVKAAQDITGKGQSAHIVDSLV